MLSAPLLLMPVPFSVSASAVASVTPFKSSVAPSLTVVPAATVPRAEVLPSFSVPALTVVSPV